MSQELILKIKKAELLADERQLAAKAEAKLILEAGDAQAVRRTAEIVENASAEGTSLLNDARRRASLECDQIAKQASEEADAISKKASAKLDKAIQLIIAKVVK